jgi:hypothetical protein
MLRHSSATHLPDKGVDVFTKAMFS